MFIRLHTGVFVSYCRIRTAKLVIVLFCSSIEVLPEKYFQHYLLIVIGFYLLLGEEVSQHQLEMADVCFKNFYVEFSELYGKKTNKCTII